LYSTVPTSNKRQIGAAGYELRKWYFHGKMDTVFFLKPIRCKAYSFLQRSGF
jgi:hypothetical protein